MFRPEDLSRPVPSWLSPWLLPLMALSVIGFTVSLWVHVGALTHLYSAPAPLFQALHLGIFIVFFPAVIIANRRRGYRRGMYAWDYVLQGLPPWMRYTFYCFAVYAVLNFVVFIFERLQTTRTASPNIVPSLAEWRGFSGHWMAFYSCAFVVLFAAFRRDQSASSFNS